MRRSVTPAAPAADRGYPARRLEFAPHELSEKGIVVAGIILYASCAPRSEWGALVVAAASTATLGRNATWN